MFKRTILSFIVIALVSLWLGRAHAQDSNGPSPLSFLDTSNKTYDLLVDGVARAGQPGSRITTKPCRQHMSLRRQERQPVRTVIGMTAECLQPERAA